MVKERDVIELANNYIMNNIGLMPSVDEIRNLKDDKWLVILKIDYPKFFIDKATGDKIFKYLTLKPIGQIQLDMSDVKHPFIDNFTPRNKIVENMFNILSTYRSTIENALVRTTAPNLSKLNESLCVFEPLKPILQDIFYENKFSIDSLGELHEHDKYKIEKYLPLLEELHILKRVPSGYEATPQIVSLESDLRDFELFKRKIIEILMQNKYATIKEIFNIRRFEPFVHISTAYYQTNVISERMITMTEGTLQDIHTEMFGYMPNVRFLKNLNDLRGVNVLRRVESNMVTGYEGISSALIGERDRLLSSAI